MKLLYKVFSEGEYKNLFVISLIASKPKFSHFTSILKVLPVIILPLLLASCEKAITVQLPDYENEMVVEMYLEEGKPLRCLLSESLRYTDTAIGRALNHATVVVSDGITSDTLENKLNKDTVTGRWYNYYHPRIVPVNNNKTYTLKITDISNRILTGSTGFSQKVITIDSIDTRPSTSNVDSFSVGVSFQDPPLTKNFYRFVVTQKLNNFHNDPTDFSLSDISFNGKTFSFFSDAGFARNDTVTIRVYALLKEHYDYIQSTDDARSSNFNPFSQPGRIKSSVSGGIGIFTAIRYDQREVIIR